MFKFNLYFIVLAVVLVFLTDNIVAIAGYDLAQTRLLNILVALTALNTFRDFIK